MDTQVHSENENVVVVSEGKANLHGKTVAKYDEAGQDLGVERDENDDVRAEVHVSFKGCTDSQIKGWAAERIRRKFVDDLRAKNNFDAAQEFIQESEYDEEEEHYKLEINASEVFPTFESSSGTDLSPEEKTVIQRLREQDVDPAEASKEEMAEALAQA